MTATWTDMATRRTYQPVYIVDIVGLSLSDAPIDLGTLQPIPIISAITDLEYGNDAVLPATVPSSSITIAIDRRALAPIPEYPADIFTRLQTTPLLGQPVSVYLAHVDMANTYSSGYVGPRLIFKGTVDSVDSVTEDLVVIYCRNDVVLDELAARRARAIFPDLPDVSQDAIIPLIAGRTGWDREYMNERFGAFTSGDGESWRLAFSRYATPAPIVYYGSDDLGGKVCASTGEITSTAVNEQGLFAKFDEQRQAFRLHIEPTDFYDDAVIAPTDIRGSFGVDLGDPSYWCLAYCFNAPLSVTQADGWTSPENAFTDDLEKYAEYTGGTVEQLRGGGAGFIELPVGTGSVISPADDGDHRVCAVIELSHAHTVRIGIGDAYNFDFSLSAGFHLVTTAAFTSTEAAWITGSYGDSSGEYINISVQNPTAGHSIKVRYFGLSYMAAVKANHLFTRNAWSESGSAADDRWHEPAKFFYSGLGGESTETTPNDSAIREFIIQGSRFSVTPFVAGDMTTGSSTLGSFDDLESDLEGAVSRYPICVVSTQEGETLRGALERTCGDLFIWLRRFPGWGSSKIGAAVRKVTPGSTGSARLYAHMVETGAIQFGSTPDELVRNAVYVNFGYDYVTGAFREKVWIDGAGYGTQLADHSEDTTREAEADASQAIFGRRVLTIDAYSINSPAVAEEVLIRTFDSLRHNKARVTIPVTWDFWAATMPGYLFDTDAELDTVMPLPILADTVQSWNNTRWMITRVRPAYYGLAEIEAIQAHPVGALP